MPAVRPPRARHEVDRPGRHRRARSSASSPSRARRASATSPAPSSSRRARRSRTSWSPTASSSATTATGPATRSPTSTAAATRRSTAARRARAHGHRVAPRWSSSPSNAFLATKISLHQRDRQRLRGDRAPTSSRSRAAWASTTGSARSSCRPASASAAPASPRTSPRSSSSPATRGYHFQLLNAVIEVNELQKRRVIGKLEKHLGLARRQADRAARAWRSSRTRTTCARPARSCSRRACRPRGARSSPTTRSPRTRRGTSCTASSSPTTAWRPFAAPTPWSSSPSGTSSVELDLAAVADAMRGDVLDRRAQRARPRRGARSRPALRGHRPPGA